MDLKKYIRSIPDYPKKGILFRDIATLIKDEKAFEETINQIVDRSKKFKVEKIAAILLKLKFLDFLTIKSMQYENAFSFFIKVVISLNKIPFLG